MNTLKNLNSLIQYIEKYKYVNKFAYTYKIYKLLEGVELPSTAYTNHQNYL